MKARRSPARRSGPCPSNNRTPCGTSRPCRPPRVGRLQPGHDLAGGEDLDVEIAVGGLPDEFRHRLGRRRRWCRATSGNDDVQRQVIFGIDCAMAGAARPSPLRRRRRQTRSLDEGRRSMAVSSLHGPWPPQRDAGLSGPDASGIKPWRVRRTVQLPSRGSARQEKRPRSLRPGALVEPILRRASELAAALLDHHEGVVVVFGDLRPQVVVLAERRRSNPRSS